MAQPKSPLLSLGARGTIGDALTYQKRNQGTIARVKPIPKDPYSLAQAYQRWDYRDYAYLWTLETEASKQTYRTRASRYHITGYSLWMREHLRDLPNLAGRWRLDLISNSLTPDSSKNNNPGTVFGATPVDGVIDKALFFDGLDDYINCGISPSLNLTNDITIEAFLKPAANAFYEIVGNGWDDHYGYRFMTLPDGSLRFDTIQTLSRQRTVSALGTVTVDEYAHFAATRSGAVAKIYKNGNDVTAIPDIHLDPTPSPLPLSIGVYTPLPLGWLKGVIDEVHIYNRVLDPTEIKRHSERSYPP